MNGKVEALPCPFCGSPANLIHPLGEWLGNEKGYGPDGSRYVCSALYDNPSRDCGGRGASYGPDQDAEALAAWNTRTTLSPQPADAVREALAKIEAAIKLGMDASDSDGGDDDLSPFREAFGAVDFVRAAFASDPTPATDDREKLTEAEWRLREDLREHWYAFCDCDPFPGKEDFCERMEAAGFIEADLVHGEDLEGPFASELGIEPGGMIWRLTDTGRTALATEAS